MSYTTLTWRKSSRCIKGADCVEVASLLGGLWGVRDSTSECAAVLTFPVDAFGAWAVAAKSGQFDQSAC